MKRLQSIQVSNGNSNVDQARIYIKLAHKELEVLCDRWNSITGIQLVSLGFPHTIERPETLTGCLIVLQKYHKNITDLKHKIESVQYWSESTTTVAIRDLANELGIIT